MSKEKQVGCSGCTKCGYPSEMIEMETFSPLLRIFYHKECYDRLGLKGNKTKSYELFEVVRNGEKN